MEERMAGRKKLEHILPWIVRDHLAQKLFSQMGRLRPRAKDWTQRALVGVSLDWTHSLAPLWERREKGRVPSLI